MATIHRKVEARRGCGFRKRGGLYLVSDALASDCGMLPIPLSVCPTCSHGIKPSRGWSWVNLPPLLESLRCKSDPYVCAGCPIKKIGRAGLLWIGKQYYATPDEFCAEAAIQGVSRRISRVPHDFELGVTWVLLAHRLAMRQDNPGMPRGVPVPGIVHAYQPQRIEYVVTGRESSDELDAMEKRGITLVDVVPEFSTPHLPLVENDNVCNL